MSREFDVKLYLIMGDVTSEIEVNEDIKKITAKEPLSFPLYFQKSIDKNWYFSEPVDLVITGPFKEYSTEGDISYFPAFNSIGIMLKDEEMPLGISRYKLGKISHSLGKLQQLNNQETANIAIYHRERGENLR
ncbi:hypothetical protein I6N95_21380 [Vagococcus sp. BWB3-3]|uniref:Cyclophilin-like domain-containing protein n=1 Tax=Vagococcus allomyrinae TaxID=2794353 RepID=A0A940P926_9ENTE|nr:hypothetical protein [Vagococcus allomyrinae]MBP1043582.1 hypothetical protein [Vagococcus allomyrinae]